MINSEIGRKLLVPRIPFVEQLLNRIRLWWLRKVSCMCTERLTICGLFFNSGNGWKMDPDGHLMKSGMYENFNWWNGLCRCT